MNLINHVRMIRAARELASLEKERAGAKAAFQPSRLKSCFKKL
ncbi:hypothetical protein DB41_EY00280 [Neochlamydia sp. TUME1]|nr:hypothetical protein DB41_EY00280 [Neochlamydia sp. TUME1]